MKNEDIKQVVRSRYGKVAEASGSCCGSSCCGDSSAASLSKAIGYSDAEMAGVPEGANLGLGCGNPVALAELSPGETVVDLGSGAGFDCFLAAAAVGETGRVIGIDMTPEMIRKARANAAKAGKENVEFRQGDIEAIPVEEGQADLIISNCVINLAPDKDRVFAEAFRILKPGGRMLVSDIVLLAPLPDAILESAGAYAACIAGAASKSDYLDSVRRAGFGDVEILAETQFPIDLLANDPTIAACLGEMDEITPEMFAQTAASIVSIKVRARKP